MFNYNPVYDFTYDFNGGIYTFDPNLNVPVPPDHEDYGKTLKQVIGMSDSQADEVVLNAKWKQIRELRDSLLKESDWTSGEDIPQPMKDKWFPYRQALRDITSEENPDNVVWPEKPL
jgi:hypothetical protein